MTFGITNALLMQTGFVKATLAQGLTLTVDWGARSAALQSKLSTASGPSFLISSPSGSPVTIGEVADGDLASWDSATTTSVPVTRNGADTKVKVTFPPLLGPSGPNHLNLRLDFSLTVTAGGQSAVVLSFSQLLLLDSSNVLTPQNCAIDNSFLTPGSNGPVRGAPSGAPTPPAHRTFPGLHPLLTIDQTPGPAVGTTATILVNAEFVDLTLLWWALRHDKRGWYLDQRIPKPGRQANLRILGWTGGGNPMIWFACVPDAASTSIAGGTEDLVFYRPPAQPANSFVYTPDASGLVDARHDDTTMFLLARYLMSPIPSGSLPAGVTDVTLLADQVFPTGGTATAPTPSDPMDLMVGLPFTFRPVGLETAFNNAARQSVMFLPLASGDGNGSYEGAVLGDLRTTIRSALKTLWNAGAVDVSGTAVPDVSSRELWFAGHSGGNLSMWLSCSRNASDVARLITFSPSPWSTNLSNGIDNIRRVAAARKGASKGLDVFAVIAPDLSQDKSTTPAGHPFLGLDDDSDLKLRQTGAAITVLPAFADRENYWNPLFSGVQKTFLQFLLGKWPDLAPSAANPRHWKFLFFHELAVYGGDLVATPSTTTIKTFFEQALGSPSPRPPP